MSSSDSIEANKTDIQVVNEQLILLKEDKKSDDQEKRDRMLFLEKELTTLRQLLNTNHREEVGEWKSTLSKEQIIVMAERSVYTAELIGIINGSIIIGATACLHPSKIYEHIPHTTTVRFMISIPVTEPLLLGNTITPENSIRPDWNLWRDYVTMSIRDVQ